MFLPFCRSFAEQIRIEQQVDGCNHTSDLDMPAGNWQVSNVPVSHGSYPKSCDKKAPKDIKSLADHL